MRVVHVTDGVLDAIEAEFGDIALRLIPQLGAKISSLTWRGSEVLARNPFKSLCPAQYAAPYADYDASGFDECFPSIGPCLYPDAPYLGIAVPDHGELWSIPWTAGNDDNDLYFFTYGVRFPYQFHRWVGLTGSDHVHLRYRVDNLASVPFRCLWSAHPLLALRPGMVIHLPPRVGIRVDWSKSGRLGDLLDDHTWPMTTDVSGVEVDLSRILPETAELVDKLYTTQLHEEGWCALYDPSDGFYVAILFSPEEIPYVGLSINLGGWPTEGPGYYNLGLEPCIGYPDRLDIAVARGVCATVPSGGSLTWEWHLFVGQTTDLLAELNRLRGRL